MLKRVIVVSSAGMAVVRSCICSEIKYFQSRQIFFFIELVMQLEDGSSSRKDLRKNIFSSLYETVLSEECAVSLPYLRHLLLSSSPVFNCELLMRAFPIRVHQVVLVEVEIAACKYLSFMCFWSCVKFYSYSCLTGKEINVLRSIKKSIVRILVL